VLQNHVSCASSFSEATLVLSMMLLLKMVVEPHKHDTCVVLILSFWVTWNQWQDKMSRRLEMKQSAVAGNQ
jgi:hypothetical protein